MSAIGFYAVCLTVFAVIIVNFFFQTSGRWYLKISWGAMLVALCTALAVACLTTNMGLQWVLIEASTLLAAILMTMEGARRPIDTAWRFLLINSVGLAIAFLGLVLLSYGVHGAGSFEFSDYLSVAIQKRSVIISVGIWLAMLGYCAKLGIFPNHGWVVSAYTDSSPFVSAVMAAFIPVTVACVLRQFFEMDVLLYPHAFSGSDLVMVFGVITMLASLWSTYQSDDINIITANAAMMHSGAIPIVLWLRPSDEVFYFYMATTVAMKATLMMALGTLRERRADFDFAFRLTFKGPRALIFCLALAATFVLPLSPVFVTELLVLRMGVLEKAWGVFGLSLLSLCFFAVSLYRMLPHFDGFDVGGKLKRPVISAYLPMSGVLFALVFAIGIYGIIFLMQSPLLGR